MYSSESKFEFINFNELEMKVPKLTFVNDNIFWTQILKRTVSDLESNIKQLRLIDLFVRNFISNDSTLITKVVDKTAHITAKRIEPMPDKPLYEMEPEEFTEHLKWMENYPISIMQFLEPLIDSGIHTLLGKEYLEFMDSAWKILRSNYTAYSTFRNGVDNKKYNVVDQRWVDSMNLSTNIDFEQINPVLEKWAHFNDSKKGCRLNFIPLVNAIETFFMYGSSFYYCVNSWCNDQQQLLDSIEYYENTIKEYIPKMMLANKYQEMLDSKESTMDQLVEEIKKDGYAFIGGDLDREYLIIVARAINKTPDSQEYLKNKIDLNNGIDYYHPIIKRLVEQTEFEFSLEPRFLGKKINIDRTYFMFALKHFHRIYNHGEVKWIKSMLASIGVGWDHITLTDAIEIGNDKCIVHIIKTKQINFNEEQLDIMIKLAIEHQWQETTRIVIDRHSQMTSPQKFKEWIDYCDKSSKQLCRYIFHDEWNKYYPRYISLLNIDFHEFIKHLWNYLPYEELDLIFKTDIKRTVPTDEDINLEYERCSGYAISELNGKDMHWFKQVDNFDPYLFDNDLGKIGAFAEILEQFKLQKYSKM
jgi:hypothetical protein